MLERYTLTTSRTDLETMFKIDTTSAYQPIYNAAPTKLLPIITHHNPDGFSFFYWGLPPEMTKNKPVSRKLINADAEQFMIKASYKNALIKRRCLIPANGIYLWKGISKKGKVPYRYILDDEKPFLIAGIWEEFESEISTDIHTFSMITIPAGKQFSELSNVMPAIISNRNLESWLSEKTPDTKLMEMMLATPKLSFGSYPVSSQINNALLDSIDLVKPSKPMDQFGNYSLFD